MRRLRDYFHNNQIFKFNSQYGILFAARDCWIVLLLCEVFFMKKSFLRQTDNFYSLAPCIAVCVCSGSAETVTCVSNLWLQLQTRTGNSQGCLLFIFMYLY